MLEMQVAGAGNEKMVGFLLDLIEKKQKFLECPVCLEEATSPILCCPELHLVCSSCHIAVTFKKGQQKGQFCQKGSQKPLGFVLTQF